MAGVSQEFRLKNIEEMKNYFIKEIGKNRFVSNNCNNCGN